MHPGIAVPARVRRMLGSNLDRCSASGHDALVTLIDSAVEARRQQWAATAASLGEYTPGTLLSVADGFAPRAVLDG